jgi:hypothetical protein
MEKVGRGERREALTLMQRSQTGGAVPVFCSLPAPHTSLPARKWRFVCAYTASCSGPTAPAACLLLCRGTDPFNISSSGYLKRGDVKIDITDYFYVNKK